MTTETTLLQAKISKHDYLKTAYNKALPKIKNTMSNVGSKTKNVLTNVARSVPGMLKSLINNLLFMEQLRNVNWSRGYDWYCELDGVPSPFKRGGVLGLPVTSISYAIKNVQTFDWQGSSTSFSVPLRSEVCKVQLTLIDDDKSTMMTFFEQWFADTYRSFGGVKPLTECCKVLSIYKTKCTRMKINRKIRAEVVGNMDLSASIVGGDGTQYSLKGPTSTTTTTFESTSRDLAVFPSGMLEEALTYDSGNPRQFTVTLTVAGAQPDLGNAGGSGILAAIADFFGIDLDEQKDKLIGKAIAKVADYI